MPIAYALLAIAIAALTTVALWSVSPLLALLSAPLAGSAAVLLAAIALVTRADARMEAAKPQTA